MQRVSKLPKPIENLAVPAIFPTLEVKGSDRLDFTEVSKGEIKRLLLAAYNQGRIDGAAELGSMF